MADRIYNKIVICDCIGCGNRPVIRRGFFTSKGLVVIDLCRQHNTILKIKVPKDVPLNEDVLKWLLIQDPNLDSTQKYGTIKDPSDIEINKALSKIELDYD